MTTEQFAYWLQGFMEICNPLILDESQTQIIKDHLALVFDKQTPDRKEPVTTTNPTWSRLPVPTWQEPHIAIEPSKMNPICNAGSTNPDLTKKFC